MNLASIAFLLLAPVATEQEKFVAWVQQRVQEVQPTRAERKFDEVGWAKDIIEAERLAKAHSRPVFLFTHDGRINTARC